MAVGRLTGCSTMVSSLEELRMCSTNCYRGIPGDVAFGISTSGRSENVEAALAAAKALGLVTIAMTGRDGGRMGSDADIHVNVAEQSTARIQEVHRTILHAICALVDRSQADRSV